MDLDDDVANRSQESLLKLLESLKAQLIESENCRKASEVTIAALQEENEVLKRQLIALSGDETITFGTDEQPSIRKRTKGDIEDLFGDDANEDSIEPEEKPLKCLKSGVLDKVLDTTDFRVAKTMQMGSSTSCITALCNLATQDSVLSTGADGALRIWRLTTGDCVTSWMGHVCAILSLLHINDESVLTGADDGCLKHWNPTNKTCLTIVNKAHHCSITSLKLLGSGLVASTGGRYDSQIKIWDYATGTCKLTIEKGHADGVRSSALFRSDCLVTFGSSGTELRVWDLQSTSPCLSVPTKTWSTKETTNYITAVTVVDDAKCRIAVGHSDGIINLVDLQLPEAVLTTASTMSETTSASDFSSNNAESSEKGDDTPGITATAIATASQLSPTSLSSASNSLADVKLDCDAPESSSVTAADNTSNHQLTSAPISRSSEQGEESSTREKECAISSFSLTQSSLTPEISRTSGTAQSPTSTSPAVITTSVLTSTGKRAREPRSSNRLVGHTKAVCAIVMLHDDSTLASSSEDQSVRFWNTKTGVCLKKIFADRAASMCALSGEWLLCTGMTGGSIMLWSHATVAEAQKSSTSFNSSAFPLTAASSKATVLAKRTAVTTPIALLSGVSSTISSNKERHTIPAKPASKCSLSSSWPATSFRTTTSSSFSQVSSGSSSSLSRQSASLTSDSKQREKRAITMDPAIKVDPNKVVRSGSSQSASYGRVSVSAAAAARHVSSKNMIVPSESGIEEKKKLAQSNLHLIRQLGTLRGHAYPVHSLVQVGPAGNADLFVSGSEDKSIRLWSAATGEVVRCFTDDAAHAQPVTRLLLLTDSLSSSIIASSSVGDSSSNSNSNNVKKKKRPSVVIASASYDRSIKFWDCRSGECLRTMENVHEDVVARMFILADGRLITGGGSVDKKLKVWNLDSGACEGVLVGHKAAIGAIIQLRDGRVVSGARDDLICLWDISALKSSSSRASLALASAETSLPVTEKRIGPKRQLNGHTAGVTCLVQLENGVLLSGSADKTIALWDVNPKALKVLLKVLPVPTDSAVYCFALLDDGLTVAVGSHDGNITFFDSVKRKFLRRYRAHSDYVSCLLLVSEGSVLASCGGDNMIRLWNA